MTPDTTNALVTATAAATLSVSLFLIFKSRVKKSGRRFCEIIGLLSALVTMITSLVMLLYSIKSDFMSAVGWLFVCVVGIVIGNLWSEEALQSIELELVRIQKMEEGERARSKNNTRGEK